MFNCNEYININVHAYLKEFDKNYFTNINISNMP